MAELERQKLIDEERERVRREHERRLLDESDNEARLKAEMELSKTKFLLEEATRQVVKEEEVRLKLRRHDELVHREREIQEDRRKRQLDEEK